MQLVDYSDTDNDDLSQDNDVEGKDGSPNIWATDDDEEPVEHKFADQLLFNLCRNLEPPSKVLPRRRNSSVTELRTSVSPPRAEVNNFKNVELDHDLEYSGGPFFSFSELKPNKYTEKARSTSSVKAVKNFNVRPVVEPMENYSFCVSDYESDSRAFESEDTEEQPSAIRKRKNHISYLAYEAKKNEEKLKNQWALNRMTRKQTQAKYGF